MANAEMLAVLANPILPVFAILFIGYLAGRANWMTGDEARVLNRFAMTILLPVFIFRAIGLAPVEDFAVVLLLIYALCEGVFYALGYLVARKMFRCSRPESLLLGFCCVFANNAYYTLPIAKLMYGVEFTLPITSVVILDATFAFGCTMIALEAITRRDQGASIGTVVVRIAKLPLIPALIAGGFVALAGLPLPASLDTFTDFVGAAASPTALFAMGVILSATPLRPEPVAIFGIGMKSLVFPAALATGYLALTGLSAEQRMFLFAGAGPTGAMAFSLALLYDVRTDAVMQITIWTSVLTLATLALIA